MGLKKVDLRGIEPGGPGWEEARAEVMAAMEDYGCVVAVPDGLSSELRQALFDKAAPELFALPLEVKLRNTPGPPPYTGYLVLGAMESLRVINPTDADSVRAFAALLWAQGNPDLCDAVWTLAKHLHKLERTVRTMILESVGIERCDITSHLESLSYQFRLLHYGVPPDEETGVSVRPHTYKFRLLDYGVQPDQETAVSVPPHSDMATSTLLVQHVIGGLEVQSKGGQWLPVPPEPDTCTFMAGELFTVLTNGRVLPCMHRVRIPSNCERLVAMLGCNPRPGSVVRALDGLVDEEHPPLYRPCDFEAYARFKHSNEARGLANPLKAFCGVKEEQEPAAEQ